MNEERTCVNKLVAVKPLPFVGTGPRAIALLGKRKRLRRQTEDVQDECLAVTVPSVSNESRFRFPTMRDRQTTILGPVPIRTSIKRFGELPNLTLVFSLAVEIGRTGQRPGQKV